MVVRRKGKKRDSCMIPEENLTCLDQRIEPLTALFIQKNGDILLRKRAFGQRRHDRLLIIGFGAGEGIPSVRDVDCKIRIKPQREAPKLFVFDRQDIVRRRPVDGAQIDPVGAKSQQKFIELFDLGRFIIDARDDEYLDNERVVGARFKCEHPCLDRLDIDPAVSPIEPFEAAWRSTIEGEFDGVDLQECFLDRGVGDGAAVAQYQRLEGAFEDIDTVDQFVQVGVESGFTVGRQCQDIEIGVAVQLRPDRFFERFDGQGVGLLIGCVYRGEFAVEAIVIALFTLGAQVDAERFAEASGLYGTKQKIHVISF